MNEETRERALDALMRLKSAAAISSDDVLEAYGAGLLMFTPEAQRMVAEAERVMRESNGLEV